MVLSNFKELRKDMIENEKAVIVFHFNYKQMDYFVAVCLLTEDDRKKKETEYALVRLCFMRTNDLNCYLDCYANSKSITAGMTELRRFLGVEYQEDGIAWINGFLAYFGQYIPRNVPVQNEEEEATTLYTVCRHENRNPNRIYRYYMFRNGKEKGQQKHRTEYNAQLASVRFPKLYSEFKEDKTISFAFTENVADEKSEEEVLSNFEAKENSRKKGTK